MRKGGGRVGLQEEDGCQATDSTASVKGAVAGCFAPASRVLRPHHSRAMAHARVSKRSLA